MGLRVWVEKGMMVLHLRSLGEETLGRKIYEEQKKRQGPGVAVETKEICENLNVEDCNITLLPKQIYKKIILSACYREDEKKLRDLAENKRKCEHIMKDNYGKKEYFSKKNINLVREGFKKNKMLKCGFFS